MRPKRVQKRSEATVECKMFDAFDLSTDISWMITKMDDEEESNNVE